MWTKVLVVPLVIALSLFAGCTALQKLTTPAAQPFIQAAVDVAVATAVAKGVPAAQIKSIAQAVLAADTGTAVALSSIQSIVSAKIATLKLPPADAAAASLLIATLDGIVQVQLSSPSATKITAATQVAVSELFNDVVVATSAYGV
jgi:hypothetical protein